MDIGHQWGSDLTLGPTGDLNLVDGVVTATQRVIRRLLTCPGDYIWNLNYGAGLSQLVGQPTASNRIKALVHAQMSREPMVIRDPAPRVAVLNGEQEGLGITTLDIQFQEKSNGQQMVISLPVGR